MPAKRKKLSDQVRKAIEDSGITCYRISKETGISESSLSRFMAGKLWFGEDNLNALADLLGLNITTDRRARSSKEK